MRNQALTNKPNLLDLILEALTANPCNLFIFSMVLSGLFFSVVSVVIGLFFFAVTRLLKLPTTWVICFGIILMLTS